VFKKKKVISETYGKPRSAKELIAIIWLSSSFSGSRHSVCGFERASVSCDLCRIGE
jgi:hypothetical protein